MWKIFIGLFVAFLGALIAKLTGKFYLQLCGFERPMYCSSAFLSPTTRWVAFYLPIWAAAISSAWLMPHWSFSILVILGILSFFVLGMRQVRSETIERMTQFNVQEGEDPATARVHAEEAVNATLELNRYGL